MKHFGYNMTVEEARAWKEAHRKDKKDYPCIEVASELDKAVFAQDPVTNNPISFQEAVESTDSSVFASRYGLGSTGNNGVDADTALETVKGLNESDDAFVGRMKDIAQSSVETTSD